MTAFDTTRYQGLLLMSTSILLSASLLLARGQTCLSTLSQFEANVTSDRDNVDRLTGGFYPTNRPSPLVADICYYVNAASASDVPGPREASFQVRVRIFLCARHNRPQLLLASYLTQSPVTTSNSLYLLPSSLALEPFIVNHRL